MFCPNCGAKNEAGDCYCSHCGNRLPQPENMAQPVDRSGSADETTLFHRASIEEKAPRSTRAWWIPLEILAILVVMAGGFFILRDRFTAERAAERFVVLLMNGEYAEARESIDLPDRDFLSAEIWKKVFQAPEEWSHATKVRGVSSQESTLQGEEPVWEGHRRRSVTIQYLVEGESSPRSFSIEMIQDGKTFLFFDRWRVDAGAYVTGDVQVVAPKKLKVQIDGIPLGDGELLQAESTEETDVYRLPRVFYGKHTLELSADGYQSRRIQTVIKPDSEKQIRVPQLALSEDAVTKLQELTANNLKSIYEAAFHNKSFSEIADLFTKDALVRDRIRSDYNQLARSFLQDTSRKKIRIHGSEIQMNPSGKDVQVKLQYTSESSRSFLGLAMPSTSENSTMLSFSFVNEQGEWKQSTLGCSFLTY